MKKDLKRLAASLVLLLSLGISLSAQTAASPTVILISLDGFRNDYIDIGPAPNLQRLATSGVRARAMRPAFPSKTFTNHYTLVTGLLPAHHGIVSNTIYDPAMKSWFHISDSAAVVNGAWWGGEPLWATAEKQGMKSACYFWPGSEAEIGGIRPSYWRPYKGATPKRDRVEQVLAWLDLPSNERPGFITLYFSDTDDAGHRFGPNAPETRRAIQAVDSSIGQLITGLEKRDLFDRVNVVVVSDHGMAAVDSTRLVFWDDTVSRANIQLIEDGPGLTFNAPADSLRPMIERLNTLSPHFHAYAQSDLPEHLHYTGNARIPAVIGLSDEGWMVIERSSKRRRPSGGTHGYDNEAATMQATFVAHGPAIQRGAILDTVRAIDVYELLTHILHLKPAPNDGQFDRISGVLLPSLR